MWVASAAVTGGFWYARNVAVVGNPVPSLHFGLGPVKLPAGTRILAAFTYDNSSGNARNPNQPPRRVRAGPRLTDEMCDLELQVASNSAGDIQVLERAIRRRPMRGGP